MPDPEAGAELAVWAPGARRVDVIVASGRVALDPHTGGWFRATVPLRPGDHYQFSVDGGPPRPDPRSRSQPDGPHGPSRLVDCAALRAAARRGADGFAPVPWPQQVIYELHVGTFSPEGTFAGAASRLDHLVALGVTAVEVMPLAEFPGTRGWGYDGVALYAVHHAYGGPEGFADFVTSCHEHGLAVIVDAVYNHLGPDGNFLPDFGPYFTDRYATPWGDAVNFDGPDSDEVRAFVLDNARMWLSDYDCDGLRLDAIHAIYDLSAIHIVEAITAVADSVAGERGRPAWIIAETDQNDPRVVRDREQGGFGVTAQWSDDFHHALHVALTSERDGYYADFTGPDDLARAIGNVFVYDGQYSKTRRRRHGRPATALARERFVVCAQNHDQIGNRAAGERLGHLCGARRARIAAAVTLLAPFVPLVFQGEEWDASTPFPYFTDHQDPTLAQAVRDGRRREFAAFGWPPEAIPDPQDPATFDRAVLRWDEPAAEPHNAMLAWYRALIAIRRREPDLHAGAPGHASWNGEMAILTVERNQFALYINLSDVEYEIPGNADVVLASFAVDGALPAPVVPPDHCALTRRPASEPRPD